MSKCLVNIHGDIEGDYEIIDDSGDYVPLSVIDDIRQEIEEERKSVHLSAFVSSQLTGEYSNLLYDGEHKGLLKALEIIDNHIWERGEDETDN